MKHHLQKLILFITAAAACFGQQSYTATPISASGYIEASLIWVSDDGKTGFGAALQTGQFAVQCMTYQNGVMSLLPTPGLTNCQPQGANVGAYVAQVSDTEQGNCTPPGQSSPTCSIFGIYTLFTNGSDTVLTPPSGVNFGIDTHVGVNAQGQMATTLQCPGPGGSNAPNATLYGNTVPCAYVISSTGAYTRLSDLGYGSGAVAINASGDVAGWMGQPGSTIGILPAGSHAVIWSHTGTVIDLSNLTTLQIGLPIAINSKGQVILDGNSVGAFFYDGVSTITQIQVANSSLVGASSLNDSGIVVGWYNSQSNDGVAHPFYYANGAAVDLNTLAPSLPNGAFLTSAGYIGNTGKILALAQYSTTPQDRTAPTGPVQFLLTPVIRAQTAPVSASPTELSFAWQTVGNPPPSQSIQVSASGSATVSFTAAATSTGNWLSVTPSGGATPATLSVSVSGAGLGAGVFTGQIVLSGSAAGSATTIIPVTMTVIATQTISASSTSLNFTYQSPGAQPASQTIQVTALGDAPVSFTAQSDTPQFFSVTPGSGTTPATLTVSASTTGLTDGVYLGHIVLTPNTPGNAPVSVGLQLTIGTTGTFSVYPTSLSFKYQIGGNLPEPQSVEMTASDNAALVVSPPSSLPLPFCSWLSAVGISGVTTPVAVGAYPSSTVLPGLAPGNYSCTLVENGVNIPISLTVTAAAAGPVPAIASVVNAASFAAGTSTESWISIQGTNLSTTTRSWAASDFSGNNLPVSLDGVSVTVNGKTAYPSYISPIQINLLAPEDATTGTVNVQVVNSLGVGKAVAVTKSDPMPAFFTVASQYAAATHANGVAVGAPGLISGATFTPAAPGEVIQVFGTGFGATANALPWGQVLPAPAALAAGVAVTVGGQPATVAYAGMTADGLDQLNITIPAGLPDGDAAIVATVGGASTQSTLYVTVKN
jgi:uncharacterized protein (TIGR03437 family)